MKILKIHARKYNPSIEFQVENGDKWIYSSRCRGTCVQCQGLKLKRLKNKEQKYLDMHIGRWLKVEGMGSDIYSWICDACMIKFKILTREDINLIKTLTELARKGGD